MRMRMAVRKNGTRMRSLSERIGRSTAPTTPARTKTAPITPASADVMPRGSRIDSNTVKIVLKTPIETKHTTSTRTYGPLRSSCRIEARLITSSAGTGPGGGVAGRSRVNAMAMQAATAAMMA